MKKKEEKQMKMNVDIKHLLNNKYQKKLINKSMKIMNVLDNFNLKCLLQMQFKKEKDKNKLKRCRNYQKKKEKKSNMNKCQNYKLKKIYQKRRNNKNYQRKKNNNMICLRNSMIL